MKKILIIILLSVIHSNLVPSKFHYIDQIDSIKNLEFLYNESLNMGDTLESINILLNIVDRVELYDHYSDEFISNYYYKIGKLYLLINENGKSEDFFLKSIEIITRIIKLIGSHGSSAIVPKMEANSWFYLRTRVKLKQYPSFYI